MSQLNPENDLIFDKARTVQRLTVYSEYISEYGDYKTDGIRKAVISRYENVYGKGISPAALPDLLRGFYGDAVLSKPTPVEEVPAKN